MSLAEQNKLIEVAEVILANTSELCKKLSQHSIVPPASLDVGTSSGLWTTHDSDIGRLRSSILGQIQQLDKLLEGPHGFLHEYVSTNWEYGALYALLEHDVLEKIPLDGSTVTAAVLAEQTGLPADKLLRICRLVATVGILQEPVEGSFKHTAISETLVKDEGYKSFIHFQLFETRVASAHLADSLKKPNPFWKEGQAAFEHAWGMPMYDWHAKNPEKGKRFAQAMESVSKNLDAGNGMIIDWLSRSKNFGQGDKSPLVVEVSGKTGSFSHQLATIFPNFHLEVQDSSSQLLQRGKQSLPRALADRVRFNQRDLFEPRPIKEVKGDNGSRPVVFLLRGVLWNLDDSEAIKLLQSFIPAMGSVVDGPLLVISDLVSPAFGTFEPHVERAFRRRDVTLMTMHNVKQRTASEWGKLIQSASSKFKVTYAEKFTSHSCRGLWKVQLAEDGA
ncbi:hypothetical protein AJ80_09606 [Polytolypa hystricis UAMH7299]|uniref:O-methyltransferase C-terminal domain-containing protein n=1 Tax=Polytolypa hystricis (strain UAMH7299) TaxID=1447883 RepID=A0A2B7WMW5_POLH7|nr:hypothetical protein AJ80_09606 [Polytolypa hystricis UAMH7299]